MPNIEYNPLPGRTEAGLSSFMSGGSPVVPDEVAILGRDADACIKHLAIAEAGEGFSKLCGEFTLALASLSQEDRAAKVTEFGRACYWRGVGNSVSSFLTKKETILI